MLDEIESVLKIRCAPVTWPIGAGKRFRGVYHLLRDEVLRFAAGEERANQQVEALSGSALDALDQEFPAEMSAMRDEIELVKGAGSEFDLEQFPVSDTQLTLPTNLRVDDSGGAVTCKKKNRCSVEEHQTQSALYLNIQALDVTLH